MSSHHSKKITFFLGVIILAATWFGYDHLATKPTTAPENIVTVNMAPITVHLLPKTITAYGKIISPNSLDIMAQTSGEITSIPFKAGDAIRKGQLLFTLVSNNIDDQTKKLLAAMQLSHDNYERLLATYKTDPESVSPSDLQQAKLKFIQDLATYQEAHAVEKIIAPVDGVISDTNLAVGSFVNVGAVLAHVSVPNAQEIAFQLPSRYQQQAALNQEVEFTPSDSQQNYKARIVYIATQLNSDDYSVNIRAAFDQPNFLSENLFGKVVVTLQSDAKILAVPGTLVQADSQGFYVYSVSNGKAKKIYFIPGDLNQSGLMTIQSGITEPTSIITSHLSALTEGQKVEVSHS